MTYSQDHVGHLFGEMITFGTLFLAVERQHRQTHRRKHFEKNKKNAAKKKLQYIVIFDPNIHHRRSIRLSTHDYAGAGEYFVTLCIHGWKCVLGVVADEEVKLTDIGRVVNEEWLRTSDLRSNVDLDKFVIMPNHLHGIIVIHDERKGGEVSVGANGSSPLRENVSSPGKTPFRSPSGTIGAVVRGFKAASTKRVNELRNTPGRPLWQRNYYEHIVRDERDLERIREYIAKNPERWKPGDRRADQVDIDEIHAD